MTAESPSYVAAMRKAAESKHSHRVEIYAVAERLVDEQAVHPGTPSRINSCRRTACVQVWGHRSFGFAYTSDWSQHGLQDAVHAASESPVPAPNSWLGFGTDTSEDAPDDHRFDQIGPVPALHELLDTAAMGTERVLDRIEVRTRTRRELVVRTVSAAGSRESQVAQYTASSWLLTSAARGGDTRSPVDAFRSIWARRPDAGAISSLLAELAATVVRESDARARHVGGAVILAPNVTPALLSFLADALVSQSEDRGFLAARWEDRLLPTGVELIDDGTLIDGPASAPWDAEGTEMQRTNLTSAGRLVRRLVSRRSSSRTAPLTGNCRYTDLAQPPMLAATNLLLEPSTVSEDLISDLDRGFYCDALLDSASNIDPATGEFMIPATGRVIRGGHLEDSARGLLVGSLPTALRNVGGIGPRLGLVPYSVGLPRMEIRFDDGVRLLGA